MADKDYKTTIKIDGDAKGANGAIDRVRSNLQNGLIGALGKVRTAMASVSRALGVFWLAWNGGRLVVSGFQKLREVVTASARAAEQFHLDQILDRSARAAEKLLGKQKEISAEMARQSRMAATVRNAYDIEQGAQRDADSARREVERAGLLAGETDPRQRQALQDRFAREDAARQAKERESQLVGNISQSWNEAAKQKSIAEDAEKRSAAAAKTLELARQNLELAKEQDNADAKSIENLERKIAALEQEKRLTDDAAKNAREAEAAANKMAEAYGNALETQRAAASELGASMGAASAARWSQMDSADRQGHETFTQRIADNEMRGAQARYFATLDDEGKTKELDRREDEARARMTAAQSELADEMQKDVKERDQERITRLQSTIETAQAEALGAQADREALEREMAAREEAARTERADKLAASFTSSGNRLTAMGLGSGVSDNRSIESIDDKMTSVLDVARDMSETLREIKIGSSAAKYGA